MQQDKPTIKLTVPTGWDQLNDKQLRYVFGLMSQGFSTVQVKTYCLFRWTGLQVMDICRWRHGRGHRRHPQGAERVHRARGLRPPVPQVGE